MHLTAHSAYSLQEGLALPSELAQAAAADGMTALGLTDHRLLTGAVEFVTACQVCGIQPVLGLEIDLDVGRLVLLAENLAGWANLCRLSSALMLRDVPEAACPPDLLDRHNPGLIAIGGSGLGENWLAKIKSIFSGRSYLAMQSPAQSLGDSHLARRLGLPLVVTHPVYMLTPEQAGLLTTLTAVRLNVQVEKIPPGAAAPEGCWFVGSREMEARFRSFPQAVKATDEIASRCNFNLPLHQPHLPTIPLPPGLTAAGYLRRKAFEGARQIYGELTPEVEARLNHELEVISGMGYEPIFLIVEEILEYARQTGVPYSSRGSAASSLVAHCLGITSPDPLRLNLFFERFLNPARTTLPDIDTDLCSVKRDAVIQHVFDTYGEERVAMVATINRYRPRSALGDVAKVYGLPPPQVVEMTKQLPYGFFARLEGNGEGEMPPSPFTELRAGYRSGKFSRIFDDAELLLRLPRHLSVHPGGVVVAPGTLTDLVPVMRSGSKGILITQFDLESVEAFGLVKIDLLGIRGLTVLGNVAEFIHASQPDVYAAPLAVLDSTPAVDSPTSERVESGQTIGCFQIESPGMRATLKEIHARCEDDIMAALALYRPGPLTGGLRDAFVRRYKHEEPVQHIHPALAPLLDETLGVILYQEQVLRIAHEIAGFSLAEADLLRRAMSHFDPGRRMQELRYKFIGEAQARSGIPVETGEKIWEMMAAFAGYGFPKAHAASYARVSWRSAWCKTHFPAEFMAAVLANWGGYYSQRVYVNEGRRMGLTIRPPHINFSAGNFSVVLLEGSKILYMGLDQVKNLTRRTIQRIIRQRPFHSLEDFLTRADPRPQEAMDLTRIGALEGMGRIPAILKRLETGGWQASQMSLFAWEEPEGQDWTLEQKMASQLELLGTSLEVHPLELVMERITGSGALNTLEAAATRGRHITVAGVRQTSRRTRTGKGEMMLFLTLEDLNGTLDVIFFPDVYRQARGLLGGNQPLLVSGVVEVDEARGEPFLRADKVMLL